MQGAEDLVKVRYSIRNSKKDGGLEAIGAAGPVGYPKCVAHRLPAGKAS